ncbi:MAG: PepSY domain-containing protein [Treponema sp.]|nr:PepSY domain-containing protein [Treponema sp.]
MVKFSPKRFMLKRHLIWLVALAIAVPLVSCDLALSSDGGGGHSHDIAWSTRANWTCPEQNLNITGVCLAPTAAVACDGTCTWIGQGSAPNRNQRPVNPPITRQQARAIAEQHLAYWNISAVYQARDTEMDWEYRRWVWELEFYGPNRQEFEFYICVNIGTIVKFQIEGRVPPGGQLPSIRPPTQQPPPGGQQPPSGQRPTNPAVSLQDAIAIAEGHLRANGINATFRSHSGMDWERGRWVWELEFRGANGRPIHEFYICVNTGDIVKFETERS